MNTYNLPDDLLDGSAIDPNEVLIRCYTSTKDSVKNRIILNQNMINLLISGKKTIVYPGSTAVVNGGELVVLSAGNVLTSELLTGEDSFSSLLFYFSNEVLDRFLIKYHNLLPSSSNRKDSGKAFLIFKQDLFIKQFIASVQALVNTDAKLSPEIRLLKIEELLLYLLHADPERFKAIHYITHDKDELQLKKVVDSHVGQPITVSELAFLCNMSTSTFKRRFGELYHTTPQQWLLDQKLKMAADLLRSSNESPATVYLQVGYQNHSSFTDAFRNLFGCTPSEYQRSNVTP
ncbi:AraC family transcriptional regulator [Mucilaginibacter daejeonensis]|uniref:helix-turn-helix domain-containing protein n=1 Tax=Mucilaginibacter daejeonensis TaxID=398049 RepID=UPI001D17302C|nr:AraC family transcriptional regulator [Mucilaginibacter daejeonensis]UEG51894.1 AraC family transcriptional regulator [Mucilaginibacter daejeonensis]